MNLPNQSPAAIVAAQAARLIAGEEPPAAGSDELRELLAAVSAIAGSPSHSTRVASMLIMASACLAALQMRIRPAVAETDAATVAGKPQGLA